MCNIIVYQNISAIELVATLVEKACCGAVNIVAAHKGLVFILAYTNIVSYLDFVVGFKVLSFGRGRIGRVRADRQQTVPSA